LILKNLIFQIRSKSDKNENNQVSKTPKKELSSKALKEAMKRKSGISNRDRDGSASESESESPLIQVSKTDKKATPSSNPSKQKSRQSSTQASRQSSSQASRRKSRQDEDDFEIERKKSHKTKRISKDSESDFEPTPKLKPKVSDAQPQKKETKPASSKPPGEKL
jgi:hypothetical protein